MDFEDFRPRLKRLDWLYTRHPLYFVTTNTKDRRPILSNERVHDGFRNFCKSGLARGVFVGKYVIMPDHLHLFVAFGEEYEKALIERRSGGESVAAVCDRRLSLLSKWMKV